MTVTRVYRAARLHTISPVSSSCCITLIVAADIRVANLLLELGCRPLTIGRLAGPLHVLLNIRSRNLLVDAS